MWAKSANNLRIFYFKKIWFEKCFRKILENIEKIGKTTYRCENISDKKFAWKVEKDIKTFAERQKKFF